jgi:hypothetical protein
MATERTLRMLPVRLNGKGCCPCQPGDSYKFKLSETTRLQVFSNDESERTHFVREKNRAPTSGSSKAKEGSEQNKNTKGDYSE